MRYWFSILCVLLTVLPAQASAESPTINPDLLTQRWQASWITHPTAPTREYGVFHFRKQFELAKRPERFVVHVSADNRYRLFVNGSLVCDGPARGDLAHWRFETVDIASFLQAGQNSMAAVVWNYGDHLPVNQITHQTAFILQGDTTQESLVNTDSSWKVTQNPAYSALLELGTTVGPCERVDAAKYPWGWEERSFEDKLWASARLLALGMPRGMGVGTHWALVPRSIPPMELKYQRLKSIRRAEGVPSGDGFLQGRTDLVIPANTRATLLLDQSSLTTAYPELIVSGGKGSEVTLTYAEGLVDQHGQKGNRDEIEGRHIEGNADVFLPDGGSQRMFRPLWFRTFRYLELKVQTQDSPLTIHDLHSHFTGYPFEEMASFSSDDSSLEKIWKVGWHTARLCAGETYYDCPYYEQLQYVGDTRIQSLISLYVTGDDRLMRNAIRHFDDSRIPDGLTQSRYPSSEPQIIPPFSLFWIGMVHDYWMHRDDPAFVGSYLGAVGGILDWFEKRIEPSGMLGPLPWWSFVDWPDEWNWDPVKNFGGVPSGGDTGQSSILTLQFAQTLELAAELAEAFQRKPAAAHYRQVAAQLKKATWLNCWDASRGLLADTPKKDIYSQHANILAVLTGLIPPAQEKDFISKVAGNRSLIQCTFYFRFYLFRAMKKAGLADQYVEMLQPWRDMIQLGLTTFAERPEPTRSDCHAWSASPNYDLLATVCGIEPATPGFKTVRISPHLGPLSWVKGSMPHPQGDIQIQLRRQGKSGLQGEVVLPADIQGEFHWGAKVLPLKPGRQPIEIEAQ